MKKLKNKISIIIPFLNEADNIPLLIDELNKQIDKSDKYEVVFVNDGSTDNGLQILKEITKSFSFKILNLSKNYGSHNALRAGINNATNNVIVFFSADLQEPFSVINDMEIEMEKGYEVVFAYKKVQKRKKSELIFSKLYSKLMKKHVNSSFPEEGMNNVMFNKKVKDELNRNIEANSSIFLQILDLGFKRKFIPYELNERKKGKSKWTFQKKMKLFIDSFVSFSFFPIKIVTVFGMILFALGIIGTIFIAIKKCFFDTGMPIGYATIIILLMFGFGITNIFTGIVAEYLWRTLDASRSRPVFIVSEEIKGGKK